MSRTKSAILPLVLFAGSLALYLSTLAPGMLKGDSGEFQWAMASLNVAHATGYPLFTLIGHLWYLLPLPGSPAWRLNLLSPLFESGAVAMVFVLARSITRRSDAALAAAAFFALAPVLWLNASILEVYSLNALLLTVILYLLRRWGEQEPGRRSDGPLYLAFFCLGLSLAHHRMTILLAPGILVYLLSIQRSFFSDWRRLLRLALLLIPGLALYIYIPLRLLPAGATLRYAIFDIILGQEFANSIRLYPQPLYVLIQVPIENFHIGLALAAAGAVALFRRERPFAVLLALVYVADVFFALFYTVPDVEVFLTPSFVVIALFIAGGAAGIISAISARFPDSGWLARATPALVLLLAFVSLARFPAVRAQVGEEAGGQEKRAREILIAGLPQNSLLELDWETATAMRFIQTVEGIRTDLDARLIKVTERDEYLRVLREVDAGRPVYVESGVKWTRAAAGYSITPAPVELAKLARAPASSMTLRRRVSDLLELEGLQNDARGLTLYWKTAQRLDRDLASFVHYFSADGQPLGQEDHAACCEAIYGYRTSEWDPGVETADAFRPVPARTAYLQVGLYTLKGDELEPYGQTVPLQVARLAPPAEMRPLDAGLTRARALGYTLVQDGADLKVSVYWQAASDLSKDYTVFVHLLDSSGQIIAQADHVPIDGIYPTSAWHQGEVVADPFVIEAKPGGMRIEFGLYDRASGKRLPRADGKGDTIEIPLR